MARKMSNFEKRIRSARLFEAESDPFRQIVARLPQDWINTRGFEFAAGMALRIKSGSQAGAPVVQLFRMANLDHKIPWHWPLLLGLIALTISEETRGPGATKKWTPKKMYELKADLNSLKSTKNHSLAAKHLRKKFPDKYGKLEHDYFRKIVSRALLLKETSSSLLPAMRAASGQTVADAIIDIVAGIEIEIDNEKALDALVKWNVRDRQ